jgi:spore coat polysaccharide biosynthesis protein SpsF
MGSTRLPGKALADICGVPMLGRVVHRTARAKTVSHVIVATSTDAKDDPLAQFAASLPAEVFRGDEQDVLDRYYQAARVHALDIVVRITSDCPLVDPGLIDRVAGLLLAPGSRVEYAANTLRRTYPRGLDVEAVPFAALERIWREARSAHERAHVFPYAYEQPGRFVVAGISDDVDRSAMRWTVDTEEDLRFVREVCRRLESQDATWTEIVAVLEKHPELLRLNEMVRQKTAHES